MNLITFDVNEPLLKKKDKDLLTKKTNFFIGDWCLKQENIYLPNKKKYRTPKYYHWDNHEKFTRDKIYLKKIYLIILKNLSKNLNMYHNTQYPIKYWELLISRWLWTYLGYLLDRWEIVNSVLKNNKITSTVAFNFEEKKFIPKNSSNFHQNVLWSNY